jgi:hypothetical protein
VTCILGHCVRINCEEGPWDLVVVELSRISRTLEAEYFIVVLHCLYGIKCVYSPSWDELSG